MILAKIPFVEKFSPFVRSKISGTDFAFAFEAHLVTPQICLILSQINCCPNI